ncbi:hypothetical protein A2U01_0033817, partial [Trifolium medium]|nr:hypothetical protein [Trifolium medium]
YDLNSTNVNVDDGASTKATSDSVMESPKESIPGTNVAPDAMPSARQEVLENIFIPESPEIVTVPEKEKATETNVTDIVSDDNIVVNSQGDESMKILSANIGDSEPSNKTVGTEAHVIDVDNLTSGERSIEKNLAASIAKRLRSNSGKVVAIASEHINTTKETRKT